MDNFIVLYIWSTNIAVNGTAIDIDRSFKPPSPGLPPCPSPAIAPNRTQVTIILYLSSYAQQKESYGTSPLAAEGVFDSLRVVCRLPETLLPQLCHDPEPG